MITTLVRRLVSRLTSERINRVLTTSAIEKYGEKILAIDRNFMEQDLLFETSCEATTTN